jgi:hypothetical protein
MDGIHRLDWDLAVPHRTDFTAHGWLLILTGAALVWLLNRPPRAFLRAGAATVLTAGAISALEWLTVVIWRQL